MSFDLVESGWDTLVDKAAALGSTELRIVCPFIKKSVAERLLASGCPQSIQVITRFKLGDFCGGVSDTSALRLLLNHGAKIRGVQGLHAKVYLFGDKQAIVTSANLTDAGLSRNHEFGFTAGDPQIIQRCRQYFNDLWQRIAPDLTAEKIDGWDKRLEKVKSGGGRPKAVSKLPDDGVKLGAASSPFVAATTTRPEAAQSFVKFFGQGDDRRDHYDSVFAWVKDSGANWACAYPRTPKQPKDDDVIFMGWLLKKPNDIVIFGRAIGLKHMEGRDYATAEDIRVRSWKAKWPFYVRVHHAEFVSGTFANGVSLSRLMDELGANSFTSTQRNVAAHTGNTNPRRAFNQKPSVRLTLEGQRWLNRKLDEAFRVHGKMTPAELEQLDWPAMPT